MTTSEAGSALLFLLLRMNIPWGHHTPMICNLDKKHRLPLHFLI